MLTKHQFIRRATTASSTLALATALAAGPAAAQSLASFNAAPPTVTSGNVTINTQGTTDTFAINTPTAVLDFTPNDTATGGGAINFQNAGTTAVFQSGPSNPNFTVLNRIVPADPTRAVQFNGTVNGRIVNPTAGTSVPGGNIWFYSPGGVILGANAVFDVGSLLLSTADPTGGSGTIGSTTVFNLSSKADTGAAVTIQPGAQIAALNEGSYVALVAPVVNQNGTVRVNGNAAYVAAEQATLTFSGGLFDIQVAVGSDGGGTPLTHNGSTAGPSSTGASDKHGIYMVAVPKNSAITMAIAPTGQLGFDVAASVTIENGAIYLRTASIVGLKDGNKIGARMQGVPTAPAAANIDLALNSASNLISSPIEVQATNRLGVVLNGSTSFAGDVSLYSGDQTSVSLTAGSKLAAEGIFAVSAYTSASGGVATFEALGGSEAKFAGVLGVSSNENGLFAQYGAATARAPTGGSATIRASGGTIIANGSEGFGIGAGGRTGILTRASTADGTGISGLIIDQGGKVQAVGSAGEVGVRISASPTIGQAGVPRRGGTATINVDDGQLLTDSIFVDAPSFSISDNLIGGFAGLNIGASGGSVAVTKSLFLNAAATATPPTAGLPSVSATGGTARLSTSPTSATASIKADTITLDAGASFDPGSDTSKLNGGNATGGAATIAIGQGGDLTATSTLTMTTVARGSAGVAGGAGGSATQGDIRLGAFDGGSITFGSAKLDADTFGGVGGTGASPTTAGGTGGAAIKGPGASFFAGGGGTITGGKTQVLAIARAGAGGDGFQGTGFAGAGGDAAAGSAVISTDTGGKITLGDTFIFAGVGAGATGSGRANGPLSGGNAFGGISTLNAKAGTVDLLSLVMATDVGGGSGLAIGSSGGNGTGGNTFIGVNEGGTLKIGSARFELNSSGTGGTATVGTSGTVSAGNGVAGTVDLNVAAGSTLDTTATLVDFRAIGSGASVFGTSGGQGNGGLGQGGRATLEFAGKATIAGDVSLDAQGFGGDALGAGAGGVGRGGTAQIGSFGANASTSLTIGGDVELLAGGFGGFSPNGLGGDAFGGLTTDPANGPFNGVGLFVQGGSFAIAGLLEADVQSFGGDGAAGGAATGGSVRMFVSPNASLSANALRAEADVFGGDGNAPTGAVGGAATGGAIDVGVGGALTFAAAVDLDSQAFGGSVLSGASGTAGAAIGGKTFFTANGGDIAIGSRLTGNATARGGSNNGTGDGGAAAGGRMRVSTFAFGATPGSGKSTVTVKGTASLFADGVGGTATAGVGGSGTGGVFVDATKSNGVEVHVLGGSIDFASTSAATALGSGGNGSVQAGAGTGGRVSLISFGGDLVFRQDLFSDVRGLGGFSGGALGGEGKGGTVFLQAIENATVNVPAGTAATVKATTGNLIAGGIGGSGATGGGAGRGGIAGIFVNGAQNSFVSAGVFGLRADGAGGSHNGTGAGVGGLGQGGSAGLTISAGTGELAGVDMDASSFGGFGATGGSGTGGNVNITANTSGRLTLGDDGVFGEARGFGGSIPGSPTAAGAGVGGAGTGGIVNLVAQTGGAISSGSAGSIQLDASGNGGSVSLGFGTGGFGRGGSARVLANAGVLTFGGDVDITAFASGGDADLGDAGAATGGEARLSTIGASAASSIQVLGSVLVDAGGSGGFSTGGRGGDGQGGRPADINKGPFNAGAYISATGGRITISGDAELDASGSGGSGGAGGARGFGGYVSIAAFGAEIDTAGIVDVEADGSGGDGVSNSASGGVGEGGDAVVLATSGGDSSGGGVVPLGAPSRIALGQLFQDVSGQGGTGAEGALEGAGGAGGDGIGGSITTGAQAGSGELSVGTIFAFMQGSGGDGGAGGAKSAGATGGAGGAGGKGFGGGANIGTFSGPDTTTNTGSASFGDVTIFSVGLGGTGGDGTDGGVGGAGGAAQGNDSFFLARGTPVTAGAISIDSGAFGGTGGLGSIFGEGGAATGGFASLAVTNRFNNVTQMHDRPERGSLTATSFNETAFALGGTGSVSGLATAGRVGLELSKGDATIGQISLTAFTIEGGDLPPATNSFIKVDAGTLDVAQDFSATVTGPLELSVVNGGVMRVGSLSHSATGGLVPPADPGAAPGLIDIGADFVANFGGDFVTTTNYKVAGTFNLTTAGALQVGNVEAGDSIFLASQGSITAGDLTAGLANNADVFGDVEISALGPVVTGNVTGATIDFQVGDPSAPVSVQTGALLAETISLDVGGTLVAGDITTRDIYSAIDTSFDNFLIGVGVLGNVKTGAVDAFTSVGIGSVTGKVETGAIKANDSAMLLAATDIITGGINTGTDANDSVFLSNTSIIKSNPDFAVLQDFDELGGLFDIDVLATATPVRVGGAITLGGPVSTVNFATAAAQSFQSGSIAAPGRLFLDVGDAIATGVLSTAGALSLRSDKSISVGGVSASSVDLASKQNVTLGAMTASGTVIVDAASLATINGQVSGSSIQISSGDIEIVSGAGLTGSSSITLVSTNGSTRLGGLPAGGGYNLDGAEARGLRANSIELRSAGATTIGQLALQGSDGATPNLVGPNGRLFINATGSGALRVTGALTIDNATSGSSGNRLTLASGGGIAVVTDTGGSIGMFGSSPGSLAGTVQLQSPTIRVATDALLGQLGTLSATQRQQALAAPPAGAPRPEGYLQANRIEFRANELLIQNSNTASQFGGFSAGPGGAVLRGFSGNQADAIIFGRIADSSGAFKINQDAVPLLTLTDGEGAPSTVTATSQFNTCPFTGPCAAPPPPPPPPPPEEEPLQQMIAPVPVNVLAIVEDVLSSTSDPETVAALPTVTLVTTIDTAQLRTEPVITDPVTGGGNASLWEAAAPSEEDERRPSQGPGDEQ